MIGAAAARSDSETSITLLPCIVSATASVPAAGAVNVLLQPALAAGAALTESYAQLQAQLSAATAQSAVQTRFAQPAQIYRISPATSRVLAIAANDRTFAIAARDGTLTIQPSNRWYSIDPSDRVYQVAA